MSESDHAAPATGAEGHYRALERLYASAPVNAKFASTLHIPGEGLSRLTFTVTREDYHAAGAAHGTSANVPHLRNWNGVAEWQYSNRLPGRFACRRMD